MLWGASLYYYNYAFIDIHLKFLYYILQSSKHFKKDCYSHVFLVGAPSLFRVSPVYYISRKGCSHKRSEIQSYCWDPLYFWSWGSHYLSRLQYGVMGPLESDTLGKPWRVLHLDHFKTSLPPPPPPPPQPPSPTPTHTHIQKVKKFIHVSLPKSWKRINKSVDSDWVSHGDLQCFFTLGSMEHLPSYLQA